MPQLTVIIDTPEPGAAEETVEVTVVRRRVEHTASGPGLAALVDAEGHPVGPWADVVELGAARARRAAG